MCIYLHSIVQPYVNLLDKIGGQYRFVECNEFKVLNESVKDKSPLDKIGWGQNRML